MEGEAGWESWDGLANSCMHGPDASCCLALRSYVEDLEKDLHFPSGSSVLLKEWNQLDQLLVVWGSVLLRLDSAFHTAVAVTGGHAACTGRAGGGGGASKDSLGSVDEALASIGLQVGHL